jgi:glyoxylase-like metal-dependent hydrolase (beta-lactamase superfamily II)
LAELPLIVQAAPRTAENAAVPPLPKPIVIGKPAAESRVPSAERQGVFLDPQNISAVDISPDGKFVGLTTMAFRNDRNFWLLSDEGKILWGRHVDPWAPFQAAVLPEGKTCAVGLAYSRYTDPSPTVAVFASEKSDETALSDAFWNMGWLRYGSGDWRTGWPASLVGDVMVRGGGSLFTVCTQEGGRRFDADGKSQVYPLSYQRPYRMASSADGHVLAFGYLTPDAGTLDERTRSRMRLPPAMLTARDALTSAELWTVAADTSTPPVARPPEAADDFPDLAAEFNIKPEAMVPFRAPTSVALNGDGSTMAVAEYGGWVRVKGQRGIGSWNPDNQVFYCPRQRGKLRIFDARGAALAEAEFPADGLFEVHLDRQGETVWCAPQAWFARGLAGKSWLPADPAASTVYAFDLARQSWRAAWQFPDAVSDLAVSPDGRQVLVSCWDGKVYLLGIDGGAAAEVEVGNAARVTWSADGRFAAIGTQNGEVWSLDARGQVRWHSTLPITPAPAIAEPAKPVFADVPIYSVGRVGTEHAYVGDMWLIKTDQGALMVDGGASSGIPTTWQRMRAAGVERDQLRYILLSHSHGDHGGSLYLWRTAGAKTVAPESAALTMNWLMPTWSDYSIWVPTPIDVPLPLKRVGDEAEVTLCGLKIKAIFVPGHSFDSVVYVMDFGGKRVAFTGDIGFEGEAHILHRTWGDALKAQSVVQVIRDKVLPLKPDHVLTGHTPYPKGTEFLQSLVDRTEAALKKSP